MARNNLPEEEARQRVDAQPTNLEQIAHANVVFCPFWSYEYTQGQVDRAWLKLQEYLEARKWTGNTDIGDYHFVFTSRQHRRVRSWIGYKSFPQRLF